MDDAVEVIMALTKRIEELAVKVDDYERRWRQVSVEHSKKHKEVEALQRELDKIKGGK